MFVKNADHHLTAEVPQELAQLIDTFIKLVESRRARARYEKIAESEGE